MEYITVECMNFKPHEPHSWREGFLWHRKIKCGGMTKEFYKKQKPPHKHRLIVQNQLHFKDPLKLVWHCKCGTFISCYRDEFHMSLKDPFVYPVRNQ